MMLITMVEPLSQAEVARSSVDGEHAGSAAFNLSLVMDVWGLFILAVLWPANRRRAQAFMSRYRFGLLSI